jgi:hypothetical protein
MVFGALGRVMSPSRRIWLTILVDAGSIPATSPATVPTPRSSPIGSKELLPPGDFRGGKDQGGTQSRASGSSLRERFIRRMAETPSTSAWWILL